MSHPWPPANRRRELEQRDQFRRATWGGEKNPLSRSLFYLELKLNLSSAYTLTAYINRSHAGQRALTHHAQVGKLTRDVNCSRSRRCHAVVTVQRDIQGGSEDAS